MRMTIEQYEQYVARKKPSAQETKPTKSQVKAKAIDDSLLAAAYEYLALGKLKAPHSPFLTTIRQGIKELSGGGRISHERIEQAIALLWLELNHPQAFSMTTATPMGGYRPNGAGGQMKGEGAKAGYPDLLIDFPSGGYHGLRIEMKRNSLAAKPSVEQIDWLARLGANGYYAAVCRGHEAAIAVFNHYLLGRSISESHIEAKQIELYRQDL